MIFRKTAQGHEEIRTRRAQLSARERSVLILVNGELSADALAAQLGPEVNALLDQLAGKGLVEPVDPPVPTSVAPAAGTPPAQPQAAASAAVAAATPAALTPDVEIAGVKQRVVRVLAEVYGPAAPQMVGDLLGAHSLREMQKALQALEETLVMYQGRKHAKLLMDRIVGHA